MKFEKFSGSEDEGRRSDFSQDVKGSTASQGTRRDASGVSDRESLNKAIRELGEEIAGKRNRQAQVQTRLSQLNRLVYGRRLPDKEYRSICEEQYSLKDENGSLLREMADMKVRLAGLKADLTRLGEVDKNRKPDRLEVTNKLLRLILLELRKLTKGKDASSEENQ